MRFASSPARRVVLTLAIAVGLAGLMGGSFVIYSSATASAGDEFTSGTVTLGDDDAGTSLFTVTNAGAGSSGAKCIKVTYTGTLPADVKLTATPTGGPLAPYVSLAVVDGRGGSSATCATFQAAALSYTGPVSTFPASYAAATAGGFAPGGAGESATYRIRYTIDPNAPLGAMNSSATINLAWEARSATPQTLQTWGYNDSGQLGRGDTTQRNSPSAMGTDTDWATVAAGRYHSCATKAPGTLFCWGRNLEGQLGDGSTTQRTTPVQVGTDTDWATVRAGKSHTCATKTTGALFCWGLNTEGQVGDGSTTQRTTPVQVGTDTDWATLAVGHRSSCATKVSGRLHCWGANDFGQLGLGDLTQRNSPTQVGTASDWATAGGGLASTCATKTTGTLFCWGYNGNAQLGLGNIVDRNTPVQVGTDTDWASVATGWVHTCATKTTGALYCWGDGSFGALGLGTTTQRFVPTLVGTGYRLISSSNMGGQVLALRRPTP